MRILTLLLLAFAGAANAQQFKWEFGLFLGGANYQGDLVETQSPYLKETNLAFGGFTRYHIGREWAFRLGLTSGHISGSDQNFSASHFAQSRNISFRTQLSELSLNLEWEPFGSRRYPEEGGYKRIVSPFFFGGTAYNFINAKPDYSAVPRPVLEQVISDKSAERRYRHFSIPFGGGLKIDLSKFTTLSVEGGLRATFTDLLDGVSEAGNPQKDDWYTFAGFTLSRKFGPPDFDRDGIVDRLDNCPRQFGVASAQGCPDSDGDGVEDLEDVCPQAFGPVELNGCPDSDKDMVVDIRDQCPEIAGLEKYDGCPDTDKDGIIDKEDRCPEIAGVLDEQGCPHPDTDEDGIIDRDDKCPNTPGVKEEGGCPHPDSDLDGVIDKNDDCPNTPGPKELGGCPDTDEDGVIDPEDQCPNTPGIESNGGCPEIEEEEKAVLKLAMEAVRFETASAVLKSNSLEVLTQIGLILKKYPDFGLYIHGHTDSQGNNQFNQVLSQNRAKACFDYLTADGIDSERLLHEGYGETVPIADNTTAQGRRLNRRVEFELFVQKKETEKLAETQTDSLQKNPPENLTVEPEQTTADSLAQVEEVTSPQLEGAPDVRRAKSLEMSSMPAGDLDADPVTPLERPELTQPKTLVDSSQFNRLPPPTEQIKSSATNDRPGEKEKINPANPEKQYVPLEFMNQRVDSLEKQIDWLEDRILLLEKAILRRDSVPELPREAPSNKKRNKRLDKKKKNQ